MAPAVRRAHLALRAGAGRGWDARARELGPVRGTLTLAGARLRSQDPRQHDEDARADRRPRHHPLTDCVVLRVSTQYDAIAGPMSSRLASVADVTDLRERAEAHLRALAGPTAVLRDDQWTAIEALVVDR